MFYTVCHINATNCYCCATHTHTHIQWFTRTLTCTLCVFSQVPQGRERERERGTLSIRSETFMCKLLDYTIIPQGVKGSAMPSKAYDALVAVAVAAIASKLKESFDDDAAQC